MGVGTLDAVNARRRRFLRLAGLGAFSLAGGGALAAARLLGRDADEGSGAASPTTSSSGISPATTTTTRPTTTTTEDVPATAEPAVLALLCRDAWGARPPTRAVEPHTVERIMVHHSAVVLSDNRQAPQRIRSHQSFHQREGFADLAYHVVIDVDGHVYEGRDPATPGETFTDYDPRGWYLVTCEGNFDEQPLTAAQRDSLEAVLAWAAAEYGVDPAEIRPHSALAQTGCPGDAVEAIFADGSLVTNVASRMDAGAALVRSCGAEASATVAAIERGDA